MSLRLLCDENVPRRMVEALRQAGHDAAWVAEVARGAPDREVLARAVAEGRVLLTFDTDFGALAAQGQAAGVILLRFRQRPLAEWATHLLAHLRQRGGWAGHFSVLEDDRLRMRPLPPTPPPA
ncbi:DUF5615 family PIN-like protein [Roseococcus sp. DSY-14]|uniref:DUF5615 family PIN-like protein n=1 Tax=Roseococcus sp. DSY-14 TaxID=3369650 RepID=UPI00387B2349